MKKKYQKPKIKQDRIKTNFFSQFRRVFDSVDTLTQDGLILAKGGSGCSICISWGSSDR